MIKSLSKYELTYLIEHKDFSVSCSCLNNWAYSVDFTLYFVLVHQLNTFSNFTLFEIVDVH